MARKMPRRLVALSASAIAAVYVAGYVATRDADLHLDTAAPQPQIASIAAGPPPALAAPPAVVVPPSAPPGVAGRPAPPFQPRSGGERRFAPGGRGARGGQAGDEGQSGRVDPGSSGRFDPSRGTPPQSTAPSSTAPSATLPSQAPAAQPATATYRDGTFQGAGNSRRGGVDVAVTIQGGRITDVSFTRVWTQYPVSRIAGLPAQVVARQSAQVDRVTGATYSVQAFQQAVQQALAQAQTGGAPATAADAQTAAAS